MDRFRSMKKAEMWKEIFRWSAKLVPDLWKTVVPSNSLWKNKQWRTQPGETASSKKHISTVEEVSIIIGNGPVVPCAKTEKAQDQMIVSTKDLSKEKCTGAVQRKTFLTVLQKNCFKASKSSDYCEETYDVTRQGAVKSDRGHCSRLQDNGSSWFQKLSLY